MDLSQFPRTQVTLWLSYDYSLQEKEHLLKILAERFGIREVDEIPVNDAHERLLSFFINVTDASYQPLLEFLKQQKHAGVLSEYEQLAVEDERGQHSE